MDTWKICRKYLSFIIFMLILVGCGRQDTTPYLTFVEVRKNGSGNAEGLRGAWSVTISPDGRHVYATGYRDDSVEVFRRDRTTGKLTFVEVQKEDINGVDGLMGACSVTVSPDGRHCYVAGHLDHMVAVFSRDQTTGRLTFIEKQQDGVNGVTGLNIIQGVTVSPDGKHVYTAGYRGYAVTVFSRNNTTGKLTFVEVQKDGVNGVHGLRGASYVTVSPDGKHVYAAGYFDSAVSVFSRDSATGRLTLVEIQKDGIGGVEGLRGVLFVAVSPNGRYVYATGRANNTLGVFSRDHTTGKLTFAEIQRDGIGGVNGLREAAGVAVSPDGNGSHVYVAGNGSQAVSVFKELHP